jgi:hypothetical protein
LRDTLHEERFTGYGFALADFFSILLRAEAETKQQDNTHVVVLGE